jgi:hypothetical protein
VSARYILVVEKDAIFQRLAQDQVRGDDGDVSIANCVLFRIYPEGWWTAKDPSDCWNMLHNFKQQQQPR